MRIIKKYPNRRLYDTTKSTYIKLAEVHELVKGSEDFKVVDANTGNDITRSILIQIIIEQEGGDKPIFTTDMLTHFIRFYDDATHVVFGEFLEKNLSFFAEQQQRFSEQAFGMIDNPFPKLMQEATERNMAMWQDMQAKFMGFAAGAAGRKQGGKE